MIRSEKIDVYNASTRSQVGDKTECLWAEKDGSLHFYCYSALASPAQIAGVRASATLYNGRFLKRCGVLPLPFLYPTYSTRVPLQLASLQNTCWSLTIYCDASSCSPQVGMAMKNLIRTTTNQWWGNAHFCYISAHLNRFNTFEYLLHSGSCACQGTKRLLKTKAEDRNSKRPV